MIQTFPSSFKWVECKTEAEQMIGNAAPVKLAEFVARALLAAIGGAERWLDMERCGLNLISRR